MSGWRLAYHDKDGIEYIGQPFDVSFSVIQPEMSVSKVVVEEKKEKPVVEVKKEEKPKKVYGKNVLDKAQKVLEIFPSVNKEDLLEFISASPNLTVDELVESYMMA